MTPGRTVMIDVACPSLEGNPLGDGIEVPEMSQPDGTEAECAHYS